MKFHVYNFFLCLLASCLLTNCATAPEANKRPSTPVSKTVPAVTEYPRYIAPGQIDPNAKRFLKSIKTGEFIYNGFTKEMKKIAANNPSLTEVVNRAFANITSDDFENIAAKVYTRHLSKPTLEELMNFTEGPVGGRFFRSIFTYIAESKPIDNDAVMRQFNADELTTLLKFTQSNAFVEMQSKLPTINKEMSEEGQRFSEAVIKFYVKNTK